MQSLSATDIQYKSYSNKAVASLLQTMYPSVQATIWGNVGKVTELLDTVLDCFIKVFSLVSCCLCLSLFLFNFMNVGLYRYTFLTDSNGSRSE